MITAIIFFIVWTSLFACILDAAINNNHFIKGLLINIIILAIISIPKISTPLPINIVSLLISIWIDLNVDKQSFKTRHQSIKNTEDKRSNPDKVKNQNRHQHQYKDSTSILEDRNNEILNKYGFTEENFKTYTVPLLFCSKQMNTSEYEKVMKKTLASKNLKYDLYKKLSKLSKLIQFIKNSGKINQNSLKKLLKNLNYINKFKEQYNQNQSGIKGENNVFFHIKKYINKYVLRDVNLYENYNNPRTKRKVNQIDIMIICPRGIFTIEVKNNYSNRHAFIINNRGYIAGTKENIIKQMKWHYDAVRNFLRRNHCYYYHNYTHYNIPIINIGVSSRNSIYNAKSYYPTNYYNQIITIHDLIKLIKRYPILPNFNYGKLAGLFNNRRRDRTYNWIIIRNPIKFNRELNRIINYCEIISII